MNPILEWFDGAEMVAFDGTHALAVGESATDNLLDEGWQSVRRLKIGTLSLGGDGYGLRMTRLDHDDGADLLLLHDDPRQLLDFEQELHGKGEGWATMQLAPLSHLFSEVVMVN